MPADNDHDMLDRWLGEQVRPLPPPPGTFELITRRARRRKIRKALVTVASAAAVAAAIGVAVPVGMSLNVSPPAESGRVAAGEKPAPSVTASPLASGAAKASASAAPAARPSATATGGRAASGYLPPDFTPVSVTWDSLTTGWIMGPAGTPGQCANPNPDICTSVARTDDGGKTWHGLPAPDTVSPGGTSGVTGLRFLNASYGWAFGPELWATGDGGKTWHKVDTGGAAVTDLETSNGRAFALFGHCASPGAAVALGPCTSLTLKTAAAGSDDWTAVPGVPATLTTGTAAAATSVLTLAGPTRTSAASGYLAAPDGMLYSGPLDGGAWHRVGTLPCKPGAAASDGLASQLEFTPAGPASSGAVRLGLVCAVGGGTVAYVSGDAGATWAKQTAPGTAHVGQPESLTALDDGTLILATVTSGNTAGGIYLLSPGASRWRQAKLSDPPAASSGFSYVGMTSATQGVALSSGGLHAVWMTTDGGESWQLRPIKS